ncbi:MAG: hypothetical protein HWD92_12265 [Flavobacteriia bacterium]|nr:hypothetical protein [Flavobacteriia bacterium]
MKDLLTSIKAQTSNTFSREFTVTEPRTDQSGKLKLWDLLTEIEESTEEPIQELLRVAPEYEKFRRNVNLDKFNDAQLGDRVEIMARFYPSEKRSVKLRLFVRILQGPKRTKRVARAEYLYEAIHENQLSKSA